MEHDGEIVLAADVDLSHDPVLPLRAASTAARSGLPLSPVTVASLTRAAPLPQPWPSAARHHLVHLLGAGRAQSDVWEALDLEGVVTQWFPAWRAVRNRPQRNPIHVHTVDRHMVETAINASEAPKETPRRDLLLVTAIFHDIGKVAGARDHSVTGAEIVGDLLPGLGFHTEETALVQRLVRAHLVLAEQATRSDPEDPETARAVIDAVDGDAETFEMLRVLTEADARAAGPKAWTPWRAALVDTLTRQVRAQLAIR